MFILGMDYVDPKRKGNFVGKVFLAAALTALCIIMIKRSPSLNPPSPVILLTLPHQILMIIIVNKVYMYVYLYVILSIMCFRVLFNTFVHKYLND